METESGAMSEVDSQLITRRQKSFLSLIATIVATASAFGAFWVIPFKVDEVRTRVAELEKARAGDREIIITLTTQLTETRKELEQLRVEIHDFRKDFFGGKR